MSNNDTFVRITNKEIYEKLESMEEHMIRTNGKVKLNRWIGTSALSVTFLVLGWVISTVNYGG